jgi:sugar lactone lactonase YvrE
MKTAVKSMFGNVAIGLSLSAVALWAQPTYNISTVTGSYSATDSSVFSPVINPMAVVVDGSGNVYFTDSYGNRVRKVDATTGVVTTVAGDGTFGYNGNPGTPSATSPSQGFGGPAIKAKLTQPQGLALDAAGNLYIADSFNNVISKVDTSGVITLFAGTPTSGSFEDGVAAVGANARIRNPQLIALDSAGNLYIADKENNRIRKVDTKGVIRTIAGSGGNSTTTSGGFSGDYDPTSTSPTNGFAVLARLGQPQGVAVDSSGNVYIADTANNRIRMIAAKNPNGSVPNDSNRTISTVVGGGTGGVSPLASSLNGPRGLAIDSSGNLYIADTGNNRILYYNASAQTLTQVFANVLPALSNPQGIALDSAGNLYVAEGSANRVRKLSPDGSSVTLAQLQSGTINQARGLAVDGSGNLMIADTANQRIVNIAGVGATPPGTNNSLILVTGVMGSSGISGANPSLSGKPPVWGPDISVTAAYSKINAPWGGAFDSSGNYYFVDRGNHRVRKIDTTGNMTTVAGTGYQVTTITNNTSVSGAKSGTATININNGYYGDGGLATAAQLNTPSAVAVDSAGNIYIADSSNHVIRKVDVNGIISTFAGSYIGATPGCTTQIPTTTAQAAATGDPNVVSLPGPYGPATLYNLVNGQLQLIPLGTSTGSSPTPFCRNSSGAAGDGLAATDAQLNNPQGVAVDAAGNVYIADTGNHSIREVTVADGIIRTVAGTFGSGRGGDNILGTSSSLDNPVSVAADSAGNVFWAEGCASTNSGGQCATMRIRRLDAATGTVTTLTAGSNAASLATGTLAGDGGAASKALAIYPLAVTVDGGGNVYFTDSTNRIRKLTPAASK